MAVMIGIDVLLLQRLENLCPPLALSPSSRSRSTRNGTGPWRRAGRGGPRPRVRRRRRRDRLPDRSLGRGKTTTLRILLGLDPDFEGRVSGADKAGIVFQEPRLLPWRSIEHNVRLGLPRARRDQNLDGLFAQLGLTAWRGSYPKALSLGMQRRVALARALAAGPRILVLDEPFVSLDDAAAAELRGLVVDAVDQAGMSVLMVTHNVARPSASRIGFCSCRGVQRA